MKELFSGLALFFSSIFGPNVSTNQSSETAQIEIIATEIKSYKRQIQLTELNSTMDIAAKFLQIDKYQKKVEELTKKMKEIKKVAELKRKWATEDSLEIMKKYPLQSLDTTKKETNTYDMKL